MAEGAEIEDQVDLEEDNYIEEMDDYAEDPIEEEGQEGGSDDNSGKGGQSQESDLGEADAHLSSKPPEEDEEKAVDQIDDDEKEKCAKLLALPPRGCEVFIGGISRDVTEGDLEDLCETIGDICEIRLVRNKETGESKGFAFVAFKTKEAAQQAIEEFQNKEFKGRTIRCSLSESKHRLFVGNLPKVWMDDDFKKVVEKTGPGAEVIELIKDPLNPSRNRGFGFVEYYNNACADYSRLKMLSSDFKLDGNTPTVSWADPKNSSENSAAAQVKSLYVKNIPENTSLELLKQTFQIHGEVIKVVMPPPKLGGKRDFGFIHYAERLSALKAVKETEKYEIDGQTLEVCLAKPQGEKKFDGMGHGPGPHSNFIPHPGYGGFSGNPYGSGYGVGGGLQQQPVIYGRGPMPAGMHMVPMLLPDGRVGYVLQQPGQMAYPRPRRNDHRSNGSGGGGGSHSRGGSSSGGRNEDGNRGRRYRPY
ncbi:heterogeneous nuclear ribonucleoprotein Q-like [Impatiens glandulifera]|uniref:heterogeneous nuclear ribonucleoprotein Q-like n=1 Tax=Impatiens glandulifera TaxID=253017 RepID=UPI001FB17E93|nr:heterogeneous nuclear ribonucleoprotein Q-like [Impatiens glandulifera]XP_047315675.1 heterogeneous nuclear ribonucleoprotein Q-like [Impatiens glandulifera]XP_047315676.1 heterogeneous nuclear ribonucleoprotein Q-like [Impatiens glandulifera]XP_047315677.1 heterogeneous nuclear ribonucleoprotein Q-like [Impatiens glandulifera]